MLVLPPALKTNLARQTLSESQNTYNARARPVKYREGQEVFHRNFAQSNFSAGINAKLLPKFVKCRIRKAIGNCMYELETRAGKTIGIFHAKDIRQ